MYRMILLLFVVTMLTSCDLLEQPEPKQAISIEGGLENIQDYESLLVGVENDFQIFARENVKYNDIMTGNVSWSGTFPEYVEIANQSMSVNNPAVEDKWNTAYEGINGANIIINGVEEVDASQSEIDNLRGQALFFRALEYYYLVQYYAKPWDANSDNSHMGVPLQLEPVVSQDDFQKPSRATVKEVYDQIISDLNEAEGLISNASLGHPTNGAVNALRARIALIQERWTDAASLAGEVITNYALNDDVTEFFQSELSQESIFEVKNTQQDNPGGGNYTLSAVYNIDARDEVQLTNSYITALENIKTNEQEATLNAANQIAIDTRVTQLLATEAEPPLEISDYTNSDKYEDDVNLADNPPIIRLPEMILTRAEALAEINGVNQESIDLLNEIRTRAIDVRTEDDGEGNQEIIEFSIDDFSNEQELIDTILLERRVELSFEGLRKTDLQRRKLDVRGTQWNANDLVFPIPQSQTDSNENIEQNDGYGE